jgi:hypothetical protein
MSRRVSGCGSRGSADRPDKLCKAINARLETGSEVDGEHLDRLGDDETHDPHESCTRPNKT